MLFIVMQCLFVGQIPPANPEIESRDNLHGSAVKRAMPSSLKRCCILFVINLILSIKFIAVSVTKKDRIEILSHTSHNISPPLKFPHFAWQHHIPKTLSTACKPAPWHHRQAGACCLWRGVDQQAGRNFCSNFPKRRAQSERFCFLNQVGGKGVIRGDKG